MLPEDPYGEIQMLLAGLPDSTRAIVAKSRQFRSEDEVDLANILLERAIAKEPAPIMMAEHADLLAGRGQTDEALDLALRAAIAEPMNISVRDVLARVLVDALPGAFDQLVQISELFAEEDEAEFAEDIIQRAVEHHPKNAAVRLRLAQFYAERARAAECVVALKALLRLDPTHAEAHTMLAATMLEEGDLQGAQHWIEKAKALGADSPLTRALAARIVELADRGHD